VYFETSRWRSQSLSRYFTVFVKRLAKHHRAGQKDKEEGVCFSGNIHSESDISANFSDRKEFTINTATSFDSILVIDNISNPAEFVPTNRILKEINLYCPEVKVDFAYQLARGGVAIHAHSVHDRDTLLSNLPKESFGGGIKHLPKGKCSDTVFIKGVGISTHLQEVTQQLQRLSVHVLEICRLLKRITGRPTPVVKVRCTHDSVERLLNSKIVIDNKSCVVEKQRSVRIIRCFRCQRFGHLARNCNNTERCELCAFSHVDDTCLLRSYLLRKLQRSTSFFLFQVSSIHPSS